MTPTVLTDKERADLAEAERCIDLALDSSDEAAYEGSMNQAHALLKPLVLRQVPHAQYLFACFLLGRESSDEGESERRHIELIRAAAEAGHARAQFKVGQMYDRGGELGHDTERSAHWFRLSAEQGDPYAQWVHGLNLLIGAGLPKDEALGLSFITRAAEEKFERALTFLADAYTNGDHGFPLDKARADFWRQQLTEPDVIEI